MTNNDILKKLRVALQLRNDQIVDILGLVNFKMSESEVNALFRAEEHPKYINVVPDQLLLIRRIKKLISKGVYVYSTFDVNELKTNQSQ